MSANPYLHNICCAAGDRGKQLKFGSPDVGRAAAGSREKDVFYPGSGTFLAACAAKIKSGTADPKLGAPDPRQQKTRPIAGAGLLVSLQNYDADYIAKCEGHIVLVRSFKIRLCDGELLSGEVEILNAPPVVVPLSCLKLMKQTFFILAAPERFRNFYCFHFYSFSKSYKFSVSGGCVNVKSGRRNPDTPLCYTCSYSPHGGGDSSEGEQMSYIPAPANHTLEVCTVCQHYYGRPKSDQKRVCPVCTKNRKRKA